MQESEQLVIRDATPADRDAIVELTRTAYEQFAATMSPQWWEDYRQNVVETLTADGPGQQIVAQRGGALVGSVLYYPPGVTDSGYPTVRLLAVRPEARRQGIAHLLMRECLRRARAAGATALVLHTMEVMDVARGMYERMGFVRTPEYDFRPLENELVMGYRVALDERE
jgi:predicted N-acetyltransferase YhbS